MNKQITDFVFDFSERLSDRIGNSQTNVSTNSLGEEVLVGSIFLRNNKKIKMISISRDLTFHTLENLNSYIDDEHTNYIVISLKKQQELKPLTFEIFQVNLSVSVVLVYPSDRPSFDDINQFGEIVASAAYSCEPIYISIKREEIDNTPSDILTTSYLLDFTIVVENVYPPKGRERLI